MKNDFDLYELNTFKVHSRAKRFFSVEDTSQFLTLPSLLEEREPYFILGGGANVLFLQDFNGLVIRNELKGIDVFEEGEEQVKVRVAAGEDWDSLVQWAIRQGLSGIENLAFIPGTVGAAVVQNIAAYGQNFEEVFLGVGGISLTNGDSFYFNRTECQFSYRDSIFKKDEFKNLFITFVEIELSKISA